MDNRFYKIIFGLCILITLSGFLFAANNVKELNKVMDEVALELEQKSK